MSDEYLEILKKLDDLKSEGEDLDEYRESVCLNDTFMNKLSKNLAAQLAIETTAKLIAELCKSENCRNKMTESDLFKPLVYCLKECTVNTTKVQIFRAIGNLCYYNDTGRERFLKTDNSIDIFIDSIKSAEDEQVVEVALGCLHNITNENETLKKAFIDKNILNNLKDLLLKFASTSTTSSTTIFKYLLSILENLFELDEIKEKFIQEEFVQHFYSCLNTNLILSLTDYYEEFFQFLDLINSQKDAKKQLCNTSFLETVISIVEIKNVDKELIKHAGLFLTTLLTNDEDVSEVLEYKNRFILSKAIEWLSKSDSEQLYLISAVIIANYTRSDKDVEALINHADKPHVKILNILKRLSETASETEKLEKANVIHSLLGAIRNFCIASTYRTQLINEHLIDIVMPFMSWSHYDVRYKAISVIRLILKNCSNEYELLELCKEETLESLIQTAANVDHTGVKGESSRLLCYLVLISIKYPKLSLIENLTRLNAFDIIVQQLKSEHAIMINEALLSLNICANFSYNLCSQKLKELKLDQTFKELFNREQMPAEMQLNTLKLFTCFLQKDDFFTDEQVDEYEKQLKSKLSENINEILKAYITSVLKIIQKRN